MTFYHGTTKENWQLIQQEGVLFGKRKPFLGKELPRSTYLTTIKEEAQQYGDILLQVEYKPNNTDNNPFDDTQCQLRTYIPIQLNKIKQII